MNNKYRIIKGDSLSVLPTLTPESIQSIVTSPPYFGLRSYANHPCDLGQDHDLSSYIQKLVTILNQTRRVLKPDGVLWLNLGDSFTSGNRATRGHDKNNVHRRQPRRPKNPPGTKNKELIGVPWRVALALQESGWWLRSSIIWYKPNCQPESVKDRPTRSHENMFMLTKSEHYKYNAAAVCQAAIGGGLRQLRDVWMINVHPGKTGHPAPFPDELVALCIRASTTKGDCVLDPFSGSGVVGRVSKSMGRKYVGIDINPYDQSN